MQVGHTSHQTEKVKPVPSSEKPSGPTLLDKTLYFYVSKRGRNCFWGRILNGCSVVPLPGFGTAGVFLGDNNSYTLKYDPDYFQRQTPADRRCTLVHEAAHIALIHLPRYMRALARAPDEETRRAITAVFNLAADMEVNDTYVRLEPEFQQTLDENEFWILPELFNLPLGQSMETYVKLMIQSLPKVNERLKELTQEQRKKKNGESGSRGTGTGNPPPHRNTYNRPQAEPTDPTGNGLANAVSDITEAAHQYSDIVDEMLEGHKQLTSGTHEGWLKQLQELAQKDPARLEQWADQLTKQAGKILKNAADVTAKLRGTLPGGMENQIEKLLKEPEVPWTELMRDWVLGNMGRNFTDTVRLPNLSMLHLDWVEPFPGTVVEPEVNVTWITDTSGSMSDEEFQQAIANMNSLMAQTKSIRVHHIQVDTVIQQESVHDNSMQTDYEGTYGRYGYGGTRLEAAFARAVGIDLGAWREGVEKTEEVRNPDLMVVFTDGYIEDMEPVLRSYHPGCPTLWLITHRGTTPPAVTEAGAPHRVVQIKQ